MYDVIIVGGGIVGLSIAYDLARYQINIALIEKEVECCFGVSKSNSGIVHTGFQSSSDSLKAQLAVRGNQLYSSWHQDLQFPFQRIGELIVAFKGEEKALYELYENGLRLNVPDMHIIDRQWIRQHEPNLNPEIVLALLGNSAGVINPYEAAYALYENAATNGVEFFMNQSVNNIQYRENIWEVNSEDCQWEARVVINSAGLYADSVAEMTGLSAEAISPRKGEEFLLDRHVGHLTDHIVFPLPKANTKGTLIIPTVDGNYMIGPTAEDIRDKQDLTTSVAGKKAVVAAAKQLIPTLEEPQIIAAFAGLRPTTHSGDFYIAEDRPGFINLIGIQSPGLTAAPAIAEYVRKLLPLNLTLKSTYISSREPIPRFRNLSTEQRNRLIQENPEYGEIICRCELVSKAEIREAIRRGAHTLDGIKFRTRCQMGRCHGAFCTLKIMNILHEELNLPYESITKRGPGTELVMEKKHG